MTTALIVDDEEHARRMLELFLRNMDVEVIGQSSNGFDAIHQLKQMSPDVLFLDIEMPEMNGLELAELVRNENSDVHIVFVTAYDQYAIAAFEHAAMDYLLKPIDPNRLTKTVARIKKESERSISTISKESNKGDGEGAPKLLIQLFGSFAANVDGGQQMKWRTSKEKELFAFLANQEDKRIHRDRIIECLWPEESYEKAKIYLHTCISLLRKNLKLIGLTGIVQYENGSYYLQPERITVDVRMFRKRIKELKQVANPDPVDIEETLAYQVYPFLQNDLYAWAEPEAKALENAAYAWKLSLGEIYLQKLDYDKAVDTANSVIDSFPYDEEAYRLLMKSYSELGKNNQVHTVYRNLESKLEELQVRPSAQSRNLYEEICK